MVFHIILHHIELQLEILSKYQLLTCSNTHNAHSFNSLFDLYSLLFMIVNVFKTQTIVMHLISCFTCTLSQIIPNVKLYKLNLLSHLAVSNLCICI